MADFLDEVSEDELNIENSLFTDESEFTEETQEEEKKKKEKDSKTTEINENTLFSESEGVGSEEDETHQEQEDTDANKGKSTSPNTYSILAEALKNDGVLPDLDDEFIKTVKTPELFAEAIEKQIEARFEESQKRIKAALDNDLDVGQIKQFESTISYLNNITEDTINNESEAGEDLRKRLIYQDYINKGFSTERAKKEVEKSIKNGTDIDDALEALISNKEHYNNAYETAIKNAEKEVKAEKEKIKKEAEKLEKLILDTEAPFKGVEIKLDKGTRKQVFDNINKPVHKDEDGTVYTAIQLYQKENKSDFLYKLGVVFTLTDGFKDMSKLMKGEVSKQTKKNLREMEHILSTSNNLGGNLNLMGGVSDDKEQNDGLQLDI